ncbi:hypothetical protein [Marichromatium sp. AB32]|uniref:hypothetical protein n=1 Tax=Marichromatium sp. AB32 TaxID=2483363 RepID=UPI0011CECB4E|nr:hypothetical protein [Marichromatium sp. AB32]
MEKFEIFTALGISFTASLLAVAILGTSRLIWKKYLEDVYIKLISKSQIDVSGAWSRKYITRTEKVPCFCKIIVRQSGAELRGEIIFTFSGANRNPDKKYNFLGMLRSDVVKLFFTNADQRMKGGGAICAQITNDGMKLAGYESYYDTASDTVVSDPVEFSRQ